MRWSAAHRRGAGMAFAMLLAAGSALAHVGSPDTWFEGPAGPYPIRVVVRAPGVVPGLAQIDVRVLEGTAERVTIRQFVWDAGTDGAPPPDVANPVAGDPGHFGTSLWFMVTGSYAVHVTVSGPLGAGTAVVPVQAVATRNLPMDPVMGVILAALGLFLVAGLVTIVGAAARESSLPPGDSPVPARRRRARIAMAVTGAVLALLLFRGQQWWHRVDRAYAANMYQPFHAVAALEDSTGGPWVVLEIDDPDWRGRRWRPLVADHGKLMHLFVVAEDLGAIAHLHPAPRDSDRFAARLPPLPAGRYRVYADIVHETGFAQTLTAAVEIGAPTGSAEAYAPSDPDDASWSGPAPGSDGNRFPLAGGAELVWDRDPGPIVAGRDQPLRFRVVGADGSPAVLEPYLGMAAHAVVTRADGAVFAHLHPIGTVSMASQLALTMRTPADSLHGSLARRLAKHHAMHETTPTELPGAFSIPYGFPREGRYRIWVQFKRGGLIETAAFDVDVAPAPAAS